MTAPASRRLALAASEVGRRDRDRTERGAKHDARRALRRTQAEHVGEQLTVPRMFGRTVVLDLPPGLTEIDDIRDLIAELYDCEPWY